MYFDIGVNQNSFLMVVLVSVQIGNWVDDSTETRIIAVDSSDANVLNDIDYIARNSVELIEMHGEPVEYVDSVKIIKPINLGSTKESYDKIQNLFFE